MAVFYSAVVSLIETGQQITINAITSKMQEMGQDVDDGKVGMLIDNFLDNTSSTLQMAQMSLFLKMAEKFIDPMEFRLQRNLQRYTSYAEKILNLAGRGAKIAKGKIFSKLKHLANADMTPAQKELDANYKMWHVASNLSQAQSVSGIAEVSKNSKGMQGNIPNDSQMVKVVNELINMQRVG